MSGQIISEYIIEEHKQLLTLFSQYAGLKESSSMEALHAFQELTKRFQEHMTRDEQAIFPLLHAGLAPFSTETDCLKKEHQAICELIAAIMQKLEEGTIAREEEQALHVLLLNHMKNEEAALAVLDTHLSKPKRITAIKNARNLLRV